MGVGVVGNDFRPLCHCLWSGLELGVGTGMEEWEGEAGELGV